MLNSIELKIKQMFYLGLFNLLEYRIENYIVVTLQHKPNKKINGRFQQRGVTQRPQRLA